MSFGLRAALLKPATVQIHGFSDASERAYAAVAYLRTVYENGYIDVKLIASKAKVAPTKTQTIPRLELLGATILARMMNKLSASLSLKATLFYLVDSTAVLCWIRNERLWRQYIQNRVNEIRSLSSPDMWHFCPGSLNPADLPSRGMADKVCDPESVWYNGPGFLSQPDNEWPVDPANVSTESSEVLSEVLKQPPNVVRSLPVNSQESNEPEANIDAIIDINRFGNFNKLLRVTAHVMKFINKLKQSRELRKQGRERSRNKELNSLLASEIEQRELMWITCIQKASFKTELEFQGRKTNRSMPQYVSQFGLYLDNNRVLRCKGRLDKSGMEFGTRHPVLHPPKHPFVELIIRDVHERVKHNGIRDTLTTIRERFWIIRGRESVKRLIKGCVICRKAEGQPYTCGSVPDLPALRVSNDPPFTNVGLDFAGPLYIRDKGNDRDENSGKVYILLFTCASTRAVHLEVTPTLSVPSFLRAFRRFVSRRGTPALLISDNAKTFRAASKDIRLLC